MSFSNYLENALLDHIFGSVLCGPPEIVYVGLSLTDPLEDGSGITEPEGGYIRQAMANDPESWPNAAGGVKSNGIEIVWPEATDNWGDVAYVFLADAGVDGNMLVKGQLDVAKPVTTGDVFKFAVGAVTLTLD